MTTYYRLGDTICDEGAVRATNNGGTGRWTPVVVIDPEDREQVERLEFLYIDNAGSGTIADFLQAALREFANPTPPKPEEPTGLGAVVEDVDGQMWVRSGRSHDGRLEDNWRGADGGHRGGWWSKWKDIDVTRVLSEGVTA